MDTFPVSVENTRDTSTDLAKLRKSILPSFYERHIKIHLYRLILALISAGGMASGLGLVDPGQLDCQPVAGGQNGPELDNIRDSLFSPQNNIY